MPEYEERKWGDKDGLVKKVAEQQEERVRRGGVNGEGRVKPKEGKKLIRDLRQSKGVSMGSLKQVSVPRRRAQLLGSIRAT